MNQVALAIKYRPQSFAEVSGQDMITAILSRASAEDKIAPAYLFSGTRGVGKTTMARILAKAINCLRAPTAEPCNECPHCRHITAGAAVDVLEIDAASHGGVEYARKLKEDVGFAPMECRYKVFIIDEAHMLSKEAFNALLKTLEEPPSRVTFIMATTEVHKFPATIISRCQHFIFKRLSMSGLEDHLVRIAKAEGVPFEPMALNLLARRAAGSVRDAMSMLGQVLALGQGRLSAEDVRKVLGLAGPDIQARIIEAVAEEDCRGLSALLREILDLGLDLGFFLRELGQIWRNMFLLRQAGAGAGELIDLPEEEMALWRHWAEKFDLTSIHACWQMTIDAQRRVRDSLEPALVLELFLFNLALLPRLLTMEGFGNLRAGVTMEKSIAEPSPEKKQPETERPAEKSVPVSTVSSVAGDIDKENKPEAAAPPADVQPGSISREAEADQGEKTWKGFVEQCNRAVKAEGRALPALIMRRAMDWSVRDKVLRLNCYKIQYDELCKPENFTFFDRLAKKYFQVEEVIVNVRSSESPPEGGAASGRAKKELPPLIVEMQCELGAVIIPNGPQP